MGASACWHEMRRGPPLPTRTGTHWTTSLPSRDAGPLNTRARSRLVLLCQGSWVTGCRTFILLRDFTEGHEWDVIPGTGCFIAMQLKRPREMLSGMPKPFPALIDRWKLREW